MSQAGLIDIESSHPQIPTRFDGDSGDATPLANVLEILGSTVANATNAKPLFTSASGNTVTLEMQVGTERTGAPGDKLDAGIVSFDDTNFSVDADGYVTLTSSGSDTATSNFIVDPAGTKSDYTTITAAIAATSAGDIIFVKEGNYTEDLTIDKNISIFAYGYSERQTNITVTGQWTVSTDCIISGFQLTNGSSAPTLLVSGGVPHIENCKLVGNGTGALSLSGGEVICRNVGCDGGQLFNMSTGTIRFYDSFIRGAPTASTIAAGFIQVRNSVFFGIPITTSGTSNLAISDSNMTGVITVGGSGTNRIHNCSLNGVTNTALTVTSDLVITNTDINTTNGTAAIDGAGTIQYAGLTFSASATNITTTTQTILDTGPDANYSGTGQLGLPTGTTGERPGSPLEGMVRGNTTTSCLEYYDGTAWTCSTIGSFTAGSVIFSNGTTFAEDNSNFFWDDTNNRLGLGTTSPLDTLHIVGNMDLVHTAAENDDHALEIDCNAAGFGDVKAIAIDYITGAISAGEDEECILVNIDESASGAGEVSGYEVLATAEGSATIHGYTTGININPVLHNSGTFGDADDILNKTVDVTAALASGGAGNISVFVADNDTVTIGDAAAFNELEIILDTGASGAGVAPTWEYSTGGTGFSAFSPADGTNGFRNTGAVLWITADLAGWIANATGLFEIRITRTRNTLSTTPIVDEIQISATTEYTWDKNGDVTIKSLVLTDDLVVAHGGTGASTLTGVLTGNGTSAFTASAVTDNTVIMGSTSNLVQDTTITVTDNGEMVNTSQPAFLAESAAQNNVTGNNTEYTVTFTAERFDQNSDFDGTSTFTAPVTGRYQLNARVGVDQVSTGTSFTLKINTSNRTYFQNINATPSASYSLGFGVLADMDTSDTATVSVIVNGIGADTADVLGATHCSYSGFLSC